VLDCCLHDQGTKIDLDVAVVMPDHVHMIFTPLVNEQVTEVCSLAEIMNAIKGASAHRVNSALDRIGKVRQRLACRWEDYPWIWKKPFTNPYAA